jgi:AcrR family transcriptional regulator
MPAAVKSSRPRKAKPASARNELLDRALQHVAENGLRDTSLRAVAPQLGTSHRMLIYHFGSAEEFWDAVIARLRKRDRSELRAATTGGRVPWIEETWAQMAAPANLPFLQLFFETYGHALRDRKRFKRFLSQVVDDWIDTLSAALHAQFQVTRAQARVQARLRTAVLRGLCLDLLTTGDRRGTQAALELFATQMRLARRRTKKVKA